MIENHASRGLLVSLVPYEIQPHLRYYPWYLTERLVKLLFIFRRRTPVRPNPPGRALEYAIVWQPLEGIWTCWQTVPEPSGLRRNEEIDRFELELELAENMYDLEDSVQDETDLYRVVQNIDWLLDRHD